MLALDTGRDVCCANAAFVTPAHNFAALSTSRACSQNCEVGGRPPVHRPPSDGAPGLCTPRHGACSTDRCSGVSSSSQSGYVASYMVGVSPEANHGRNCMQPGV